MLLVLSALACDSSTEEAVASLGLTSSQAATLCARLEAQREAVPCEPSALLVGAYDASGWTLPGGSGAHLPVPSGTLGGLDLHDGTRDGALFTALLGPEEWLWGASVATGPRDGALAVWRGSCAPVPLVVAMGGQSNCVGGPNDPHIPVPAGSRYLVDGVERATVKSGRLELPWLEAGATVIKRCRGGITLASWQADYLPGLLDDLDGAEPDVLLWVHGERDSHLLGASTTYADRLAPTLAAIGARVVVFPLLSGTGLNGANAALINAGVSSLDVVAVPTADLECKTDGIHYTPAAADILADRVFQATQEAP